MVQHRCLTIEEHSYKCLVIEDRFSGYQWKRDLRVGKRCSVVIGTGVYGY